MTLFIGVDLGGTQIRSVVAEATDEPRIMGRDLRVTPQTGAEQIVRGIAASARAAVTAAGARMEDVRALLCSAPGPLDHRTGVVHEAPNLLGVMDFPLGARITEELGGMVVFVDHDTKVAAVGEALVGAAVGVRDFIYITVSTGVGGAIVTGGRMVRGAAGTAGEIGHFPVAFDGPRCGCGSFGCVESFASGGDLAAHFGVTDAAQVYAAAEAGDPRAKELVTLAERALENMAVGLVNLLSPSLIVVGGSVAEHQPAHVLEPMRRAVAARAFRAPASLVRIVPPVLGADVGLIGAVLAARERVAGRGEWFL